MEEKALVATQQSDREIAVARQYPREVKQAIARCLDLATMDEDTARSMFYRLPRKSEGKTTWIEGPSVRLAELIAQQYGNMRIAGRAVEYGAKTVSAEGLAWDLENNLIVSTEVVKKITSKDGRRYSDDMVNVTMKAAISTALRDSIFKIVPSMIIAKILSEAKRVAVGEEVDLNKRLPAMFASFEKIGVSKDKILKFLGAKSEKDISGEDLENLIGVFTAIRDGMTSVDEVFGPKKTAVAALNAALDVVKVEVAREEEIEEVVK